MKAACTGVPPGELARMMTPTVPLSSKAARRPAMTLSALAALSGSMVPSNSTNAVYRATNGRDGRSDKVMTRVIRIT